MIGEGGFAEVYEVENNLDKQKYAIKKVSFLLTISLDYC